MTIARNTKVENLEPVLPLAAERRLNQSPADTAKRRRREISTGLGAELAVPEVSARKRKQAQLAWAGNAAGAPTANAKLSLVARLGNTVFRAARMPQGFTAQRCALRRGQSS